MLPDTVYSPSPHAQPANVYVQPKPNRSNEERLVDEALAANTVPGAYLRSIRPPIPRIGLLPPRFGYNREALKISDIIDVDLLYPGARVDYSQSKSGYSGTSYPSLNQF